jgi:hypothetical protein
MWAVPVGRGAIRLAARFAKQMRCWNDEKCRTFPTKGNPMRVSEIAMGSMLKALDIATNYLVLRGYGLPEARQRAGAHIARLFERGEGRALMLANLAIAAVEREGAREEEFETIDLSPLFERR